jgi:tRNA(fMet)-specific endonuclease VapC
VILLDTDTLTLLALGHRQVSQRFQSTDEAVAITIVTRIEVLQGRFDFVMKAADGPSFKKPSGGSAAQRQI